MENNAPKIHYRQKKWAPRVHTGCQQYKARRVKCDEQKPICKRCLASHRHCVFGQAQSRQPYNGSRDRYRPIRPQLQPVMVRGPFPVMPPRREWQIFGLFSQRIIPSMLDIFDIDLWEVSIPLAAHMYTAVWYASLAKPNALSNHLKRVCSANIDIHLGSKH